MLWESKPLKEKHEGEPGDATKVFRKLAIRGQKLLAETYKDMYGEDFHVAEVLLKSSKDGHMYYKKGEEDPFFFMSRSEASITQNPLTGEGEGYVEVECRVPARDN